MPRQAKEKSVAHRSAPYSNKSWYILREEEDEAVAPTPTHSMSLRTRPPSVANHDDRRKLGEQYLTEIQQPDHRAYPEASLMGLPNELRDQIWMWTFRDAEKSSDYNLLLVCREIYHLANLRAREIGAFTLAVQAWSEEANGATKEMDRALSRKRRAAIKTIIVPFNSPDGYNRMLRTEPHIMPCDVNEVWERLRRASINPTHVIVRREQHLFDVRGLVIKINPPLLNRSLASKLETLTFELKSLPCAVGVMVRYLYSDNVDISFDNDADTMDKMKQKTLDTQCVEMTITKRMLGPHERKGNPLRIRLCFQDYVLKDSTMSEVSRCHVKWFCPMGRGRMDGILKSLKGWLPA